MNYLKHGFCCFALIMILSGCAPKPVAQISVAMTITEESVESIPTHTRPAPTVTPSATPEPTPTPIPKRYTAVLLGKDRIGTGTGPRTDVFIILTYIPDWKDLLIISVPRDLYVEYGGQAAVFCNPPSERDRINRAYTLGGVDCVRSIVEHNFGLVVNSGIAAVDFQGFVELIDRMGGLTIQPSKSYADWCGSLKGGHGYWATWSAERSYLMGGDTLLCYVRARMQSGDISRNRRAQEVILAMKKQWLDEMTLEGLFTLLPFALERVSVDLPFEDLAGMLELAKGAALEDWDIRKVIFQYDQEIVPYITEHGAWVFRPLVDFRGWTACLLEDHNQEDCALHNPLEAAE